MYLHESLNHEKFKDNKKLLLLKQGVINLEQFIALIDKKTDPYILIGPAVVDKDVVDQYIDDIKQYNNIAETQQISKSSFTSIQLVEMMLKIIPKVKKIIPELTNSLDCLFKQIANSKCQTCVIIRYIGIFIGMTSNYIYDGRDNNLVIKEYEEIKKVIDDSTVGDNVNQIIAKLDNNWIAPEHMLKLGDDFISGLMSCTECVLKHLQRAKILYNEMLQGYPNYKEILLNEMTKSVDIYEAFYLKYWDILGELDMASNELIGDISSLDKSVAEGVINPANLIRKSRIDFMLHNTPPHFSKLMLEIKKIQVYLKTKITN